MKILRVLNLLVIAVMLLAVVPTQAARPPESQSDPLLQPPSPLTRSQLSQAVPGPKLSVSTPPPDAAGTLDAASQVGAVAFASPIGRVQPLAVKFDYTFSSSVVTYTEITGGIVHATGTIDENSYDHITIGFVFRYNNTNYTQVSINPNGHIRMGSETTYHCGWAPISNDDTTYCTNLIVAIGSDIRGNSAGELRSETLGSSPNRIFVIQWKDFGHFYATMPETDHYNFQIRLHEMTNLIEFVYGAFTKDATDRYYQVGIKGASRADYNNRTTTSDWTNSAAGTSYLNDMRLSATVLPVSGLSYIWTPPPPTPDLSTSYQTAPGRYPPTDVLTYTVHVDNSGFTTATAATMVDPIPVGVTYTLGSVACSSGACSYDSGANEIQWNGALGILASATVTFSVDMAAAIWGDTITNTATISDTGIAAPIVLSAATRLWETVPFTTDLEADPGGFGVGGPYSTWAWGAVGAYSGDNPPGPGGAHSGSNVWATNLSGGHLPYENSYLTSAPIRLGPGNAQLTWWQWLRSRPGNTYAIIEARGGGRDWTLIYGPVSGEVDPAWGRHTVDISQFAGALDFQIRFHLYVQMPYSVTYPGWYLDDIRIYGDVFPPVYLTPDSLAISGCNGAAQAGTISLLNNTGVSDTFDLSYTLDEPLVGAFGGPPTLTLPAGEFASFTTVLTPAMCIPDGVSISGHVRAAARTTPYSDTTLVAVDLLATCPTCTQRGWLKGHVYDYDGVNPPVSPFTVIVTPGNVSSSLDASGAYTVELMPWTYRLAASAGGYPAPVVAMSQVVSGVTTTHDFYLNRPDVAVTPTALSDSLLVVSGAVSSTHIVTITNVGNRDLDFKVGEPPTLTAQAPARVVLDNRAPAAETADVEAPVVESGLEAQMVEKGEGGYLIYFRQRADLSPAYQMNWRERGWFVLRALQQAADRSQARVRAYLDAQGASYKALWIDNVIAVESSDYKAFKGLEAFTEIEALRADQVVPLDPPVEVRPARRAPAAVEPNLAHIKANQVWAQGFTGQNIVVANIDTGVRYTHQALVDHYRGNLGGGNFEHNYNWFDPYGLTGSPGDAASHGSHTMGTMIGDDGGSNQVGVAPGATWMACQGFTPSATQQGLLLCGQFMAAPTDTDGNNPNPDMRPNIVNNSWGSCGAPTTYSAFYERVIDSWQAAGIYPVFANGNALLCPGGLGQVDNPARYSRVTGVGALGRDDGTLADYSLWGPTDQADTWNPLGYPYLKPQVSAPGTNRSAEGGSDAGYMDMSGTSVAAPHVAGLVALMWSAAPCLIGNYTDTESILMLTAMPAAVTPGYPGSLLDGPGGVPNQATGWGEIDALAAVEAAASFCDAGWAAWASESPISGTVAPTGSAQIQVVLTCTYSDTLKPQPMHAQLLVSDNDPAADQVIDLSLDCRGPALQLSQSAPATANSGDIIPLTLTMTSSARFDGAAALTDALPSGLTYAGNLTATAGTPWESDNVIHWAYTPTNVLHLPLDETPGATTFADASGYGHDGACTGASCPIAGRPGKLGRAAQFDGADVITVPDAPSLRAPTLTLSAWFRWDGVGSAAINFLTAKGFTNMELHTGGDAGVNGLRFIPAGYPKTTVDASGVITTGWNHVAATYDGSAAYLYVNGALVGSRTGITNGNDLTADSASFYVGRRSDGTYPFDGVIDDVRLYDRVLSAAEITSLAGGRMATLPEVVTVTFDAQVSSAFTWNGAQGTDWGDPANWNPISLHNAAYLVGGGEHATAARDIAVSAPPSTLDNVIIPTGAPNYPLLSAHAAARQLTIESGGELSIPAGFTLTVEAGLVNSGTLSIQRSLPDHPARVNFHIYDSHLLTMTYYGVEIAPAAGEARQAAMGLTWVEIQGNAECTQADPLDTVNRCVRITPAVTNTSALVRIYYLDGELDGMNPAAMQVWQWVNGAWLSVGATVGVAPGGCYVEGVASHWGAAAPFALRESGVPTAVTLHTLGAPGGLPPVLALGLALVAVAVVLRAKKKG